MERFKDVFCNDKTPDLNLLSAHRSLAGCVWNPHIHAVHLKRP